MKKTPEQLQEENESTVMEEYARMSRLFENEDFQWFEKNIIQASLDRLKEEPFAMDVTHSGGQLAAAISIRTYQRTKEVLYGIFENYKMEVERIMNSKG